MALFAVRRLRARRPLRTRAADHAPVLLRGKELRSAFILRLLAVERWARGSIILLLGIAVLRFESSQVSIKELIEQDLRALKPFFDQINFNVSDSRRVRAPENSLNASPSALNLAASFLIFYGAFAAGREVGSVAAQTLG